jgi:hypothetical protein
MVWWFNTKVALHIGVSNGGKHSSVNSNAHASQHACASLCDEVVILWRLAALNPGLSPQERSILSNHFHDWHYKIVYKVEFLCIKLVDIISRFLQNELKQITLYFSGGKKSFVTC